MVIGSKDLQTPELKRKNENFGAVTLKEIKLSTTLTLNNISKDVDRLHFRTFIDEDVVQATVDLFSSLKIGEGSFSQVYQCPMVCKILGGDEKTVEVALKVLKNPEDQKNRDVFIGEYRKESYITDITKGVPNVAGDAIPIEEDEVFSYYLVQKLYSHDGHYFSKTLTGLTQSQTMGILADVLRGGATLEKMHIFHIDLKPKNVLFDQDDHVHLGDLGGALHFPPLEEMTPEFLRQQLHIVSKSKNPKDIEFVSRMSERIEQLDIKDKIYLLIYCQTAGLFKCQSTKTTSCLSLLNAINEGFGFFFHEFENPSHSEEWIRSKYKVLKDNLIAQMTFQLASTAICLISLPFYDQLRQFRSEGFYTGDSKDPLTSIESIQNALNNAQVTDLKISKLLFQMLNADKFPTSPNKIYSKIRTYL